MAKIGTAHVEIKPVLNEGALDALVQRIEDAIAQGVERALAAHAGRTTFNIVNTGAVDPAIVARHMPASGAQ